MIGQQSGKTASVMPYNDAPSYLPSFITSYIISLLECTYVLNISTGGLIRGTTNSFYDF